MKLKRYRLKINSQLPYEIEVWDPRSDEPIPDWLSDILQLKYFNENGIPEFNYIKDKEGNLSYYIPATNSHLKVDASSMIARDIHNGLIFPIKLLVLNTVYELKINKCDYIVTKIMTIINQIIQSIHGVIAITTLISIFLRS